MARRDPFKEPRDPRPKGAQKNVVARGGNWPPKAKDGKKDGKK